jgi:RNA polymerase sigma-70 factor, ECF subfamily
VRQGRVVTGETTVEQRAAEAVARRSYGKLVAYLSARTRDVAGAEDALSEAFAAALRDWPQRGVPHSPEAWLLTVARRKMIDMARQRRGLDGVAETLRVISDLVHEDVHDARDAPLPDERLALMFVCAHPAIAAEARAPLMLQTILGFDAGTIASAFLVAPATMGQRLVRAKTKIRQAGIAFRLPERSELRERLDVVLDAIYAAFAEGWADPAGTEARRRNLAEEAIWLGRLVASLLPQEPEALGLLALMLHAQARRGARRDDAGGYVPLAEQDTARWDAAMIDEAEALLHGASALGAIGRFQLEAAVQSAHAVRRHGRRADWAAIEQLYAALAGLTGSPVVAINRAVAINEVRGPAAALAALDAVADDARLAQYQPYWAARAGVLQQLGDDIGADRAYELAIGLERDPAVRAFLQQRRSGSP